MRLAPQDLLLHRATWSLLAELAKSETVVMRHPKRHSAALVKRGWAKEVSDVRFSITDMGREALAFGRIKGLVV